MALRASMEQIITRMRNMIGDSIVGAQVFTDEQLQDRLDERKQWVRYAMLEPWPTPEPNTGIIQYLDYFAYTGPWESDAQLFGPAWQPLTASEIDFWTGHWTFNYSQIPTVWVTGQLYDLYGSAADVLEMWAATDAANYDFAAQSVKYARSQVMKQRLALAATYRQQQRIGEFSSTRDDQNSDYRNTPNIGAWH